MDWKERMDEKRNMIQLQVKDLKKKYTNAKGNRELRLKINGAIDRLTYEANRYNSSKFQPVRLENGAVVNMKTINAFMKKLKRDTTHEVKCTNEDVQLHYKTRYGKGRLILVDMREYFIGWDLPGVTS